MILFPPDLASQVGDVASVASLGVTIYLTKTALQVRKDFQRRILLPGAIADLSESCRLLTTMIHPVAGQAEIGKALGMAEARLKLVIPYMDRPGKKSVEVVLAEIESCGHQVSPEAMARISKLMWKLSTELEGKVRTIPWEK